SDRTAHIGAQDRPLPLILGHEASGIVERVGAAVTAFAPGDHVVGAPSAYCGRCTYCLRGLTQHCADKGLTRTRGGARLTRGGGGVAPPLDGVGLGRTIERVFGMTGVRGQVIGIGVARPDEPVTLPAVAIMALEKSVQGSRLGSANFGVDVPLYSEMYLRGQL